MQSTRKPCFLTTLLLFLLLVSTAHGAELANAADAAAAADRGERTTVRTGATGHAGHSYSSHNGAHPNRMPEQGGGTGVVDPCNLAARSHHGNGAAGRVIGYSSPALLGAFLMVALV